MGEVLMIAVDRIRENPNAIRNVDKTGEEYLGLVESIRGKGFAGAITVREIDGDGEGPLYAVVDGMHRSMAAKDAGVDVIPCTIMDLSEADSIEMSIMANVHKKDTTTAEYRKGIRMLMDLHPMLTESELAVKLGKSPGWLRDMLSLNKIENDEINNLINEGKITLSNAYALAKLPADEQINYLTEAQTMSPGEFVPKVNDRVKEIKDAKRAGKNPEDRQFVPSEYMQKMSAIKEERDSGEIAAMLISEAGLSTPEEGFKMALNWVLHVDPLSVDEQKQEFEAKEEVRKAKKAEREAAKAAKKKEEAQKKLDEAAEAEAKALEAAGKAE